MTGRCMGMNMGMNMGMDMGIMNMGIMSIRVLLIFCTLLGIWRCRRR